MQSVIVCGTCESGQVCKLKDDGFVDLCPKKPELLKRTMQNKTSSEKKVGPKAVHKKEADGKGKKRQRRKIKEGEQFTNIS